jgi:hypothetical protein
VNLHSAFVPPAEVRQSLLDLLADQEPATAPRQGARASRGLFRRSTPEPAPAPSRPLLDVVRDDRLVLPITDFGNVTSVDARRLIDAVQAACADFPRGVSVRVSGGAALIDPNDRSVWAEIEVADDDLDVLRTIAREVVSAVEPLGLFCDRRQFRPRFAVATINDATTVEHLEQVLAALSAYRSEPWEIAEVAILQRGVGVWRTVAIGG